MCHSHRQEPLELFCESCDLLCCSSCHLSSHKNHRVVPIGTALQDQQWLFESLMLQAEEKRAAVESNAKQIEDRLHAVKIAHRKAENQIKMAKMIMMNELNKRANLLIEQLEKISEGFQQRLEDQLQGAIEACAQLEHIQKFISWVTTDQCRGPVLFSRALISLHMQRLLESPVHAEAWSPVKIKFNWDASYWTKQISSLGQLTVEGGNCSYPPGLQCSSVLRPQPITCLALPSVFHRSRETPCGYQACCEPQICCLHNLSSQQNAPSLDKSQLDPTVYNSRCAPLALFSTSIHQSQQLQRCWDLEGSGPCPVSASSLSATGHTQRSYSQVEASYTQTPDSQTKSKPPNSHYQHQNDLFSDSQSQQSADQDRSNQKSLTSIGSQQEGRHPPVDREEEEEEEEEEDWEERRSPEEGCEERAADAGEDAPTHQQLEGGAASELRRAHQRSTSAHTSGDCRDGRRSASLEVSLTAHECASDVQSCRLSLSSACARRKRRSQSIPTELAAPRPSPLNNKPTRCAHSPEAGTADKCDIMDQRQRRASDGVLCVVKEAPMNPALSRGHRSPLLSYKLEPDPPVTWKNETNVHGAQECRKTLRDSRNSSSKVHKDSERVKVPVVCLERLKILVSQLPSHGRRQSDPLPASGKAESDASVPQQRSMQNATTNSAPGHAESRMSACSFTASYGKPRTCDQPTVPASKTDSDVHISRVSHNSHKTSALPSADPDHVPQSYPALELESDSNPRSITEESDDSQLNPQPESDVSADCELNTLSSSEVEFEHSAEKKSAATRDSVPSLDYEAESDAAGASEDGQEVDASTESAESDVHPHHDPAFLHGSELDAASDHCASSQASVESDLYEESELELTTDDPQPLRSDLEEEAQVGPSQRPILIANPEQDSAEMESEDFCAVCLIGGDLLCCDHCPKVFHLSCHIPPLLNFPLGDWVCSLCADTGKPEVPSSGERARKTTEQTSAHELSACDQRKCERLTLLILCNILSAPFHEPVSPLARHYYQIIKRPMDLSVIRAKLSKGNSRRYTSPDQFVSDVYLMFRNCAKFNYPDSEVAHAGRSLEQFFSSKVKEVFPNRVFPPVEADSDSDEYDEAYRMTEAGFLWPEQGEQCHRKRKRRQSLKSRRHHF